MRPAHDALRMLRRVAMLGVRGHHPLSRPVDHALRARDEQGPVHAGRGLAVAVVALVSRPLHGFLDWPIDRLGLGARVLRSVAAVA